MKKYFFNIVFIAIFLVVAHPSAFAQKFKIGFSQCTTSDLWRQTQIRLMEIELSSYPNMEMIVKDAEDDSKTQIEQIEDFIRDKIDLLIVSPNEAAPITPVVEKAFNSGIPVIVIDRKIETSAYTTFIGGDNYVIGIAAGNYAVKLLGGKGKVFEIRGKEGCSPAQERHNGFFSVLSQYPDIEIVNSVAGDWKGESATKLIKSALERNIEIDLVFAHNDVMAENANKVIMQSRNKRDIYILGVDGMPGKNGGIQMVLDNIIDATFLYQTGGGLAIQTANKILNGKTVPKQNIIPTITIDKSNAQMLKEQSDHFELLHSKIERQKLLLAIEVARNRSQKIIMLSLIAVLTLAAALAVLIYFSLRNKKRKNLALREKNNEIEKQNKSLKQHQKQLIKMSHKLEEATQAKLSFFTNISHEFRTPLTLIKGPLENLMQNNNLASKDLKMYEVMHRNTVRLLHMVDQLLDIRKLENKKTGINATENNLDNFIQEIYDSFHILAENLKIDFSYHFKIKEKNLWFDYEKMENVLYNILSNAFKYTPEGGKITISVTKQKVEFPGLFSEEVCIAVSDTGVGIKPENLNKVFERFYHNGESKIVKGSGIGLNFSKELVELHRGKITIKSKIGEGTTFRILLPVDNLHLLEDEINKEKSFDAKKINNITAIARQEQAVTNEKEVFISENAPLILIVEDIPDVLEFVKYSLGNRFKFITAENGKEAIQKVLNEEPDLIISDVMMPEMDGFEFTRKLKSEIETNHIPIILLTAKTSLDDKIKGIEVGADCFIEKPFNSSLLKTQVVSLLKSREKLRKHFKENLDLTNIDPAINQKDKKFLIELKKIVLQNIGNENLNMDELGQLLGISRVQLYRKVKKLTDMSVSEFIISVKLKKSLEFLRNSGKTITEIAYESGFSSQSYYTRCFKEQFKISPSEFMNQARISKIQQQFNK